MRPHPVELFLRTTIGRAYLRVAGQLREPSWVIFDLVTPLLTTVGLVYFFRSLQAPEAFVGFVALGGAMATYWLNVLWNVASHLFWDREGVTWGSSCWRPPAAAPCCWPWRSAA